MNKDKLIVNLKYLVDQYITDEQVKLELQEYISSLKTKYVLAEIDRNKVKEYSDNDKGLIKDICYYYCQLETSP